MNKIKTENGGNLEKIKTDANKSNIVQPQQKLCPSVVAGRWQPLEK